ncbi:MAG TPA: hypothetical protein PKE40_12630 [Arachnia sp.]|nr:hypothetical protein [Arachnia sp.]HMT87189.1 hypothetical protein [Arachnia sp.]
MLKRIGLWGFVAVALAIMAWGVVSWASPGATCRGVQMGPGDVCGYMSRTSTVTDREQTYEERIASARASAPVIVATGAAALVFGAVLIRKERAARQ